MKHVSRFLINMFLILMLVISTGNLPLQAAVVSDKQPASTIRYVGRDGDTLLFDVDFPEKVLRFRIVDDAETVLFDERIIPNTGTKRFKITMNGIRQLRFEAISKEGKQRHTFSVAYQVEEKLYVTQIR